ncbi:glutathione S-transferase [Brevundimonas sp. S30B]|uniref:glutathione S-transferase family protein n=1 Tax=unclassified Brevundimonas TaxID=2622653 RepID=UPI00107260B6|nr:MULTISPECIES: glutathione S-transferase N-terminal domain-containing protein [unclassified Brevundimonas]QBX38323.1 glutathione S-transferase [Brevundimonas sp. MF30-B]TFW02030.1 glutathione S-transferase [Brevundimonas sp. S30B]
MLKLYYSPGACAMASHFALEEAGADYELVKIDLKKGEQKTPEYLAINPAGVTPALVTSRGVLTENVAIVGYVAQTHPDAKLAPTDDSFAFGKMQSVNAWLGSSLHPAIGKVLFSRPPLEGAAREAALKLALEKYDLAEQHLLKGPWVTGEAYTVADGYLSVFTRWARQADLLDKGRYPQLNAHLDAVQARPAAIRALEMEGLQPV